MDPVAISAEGLGKHYRVWTHPRPRSLSDRVSLTVHRRQRRTPTTGPPRRDIWALRNVSFDVRRGEVLGIIGPNGAGKSTLLSILARITDPTEGRAEIRGRVSSLLEVGTGFHPELSGRDNVFLNGAILGMSRRETAAKFDEIVDFSGVGDFIDMPVKRYSSGMHLRLAFAVAAHLDPEILLLDEVLAVGDRSFQEKCLARISEMTHSGRTVIFVSHEIASVARLCNRGLVLEEGNVAFLGHVDEAIARYLSSRTLGGSEARPREGSGEVRIERIEVEGPDGGGVVRADRPAVIRVDLRTTGPVRREHLRLQLGIHSTHGGMYVSFSTDFDPARPLEQVELDGSVTVLCRLDELPLKPGSYFLSASIERAGGEIIDRITEQGLFAIVPTDYFGTGVFPGDAHLAPLLVRHQWEVTPAVEAAHSVEMGGASR